MKVERYSELSNSVLRIPCRFLLSSWIQNLLLGSSCLQLYSYISFPALILRLGPASRLIYVRFLPFVPILPTHNLLQFLGSHRSLHNTDASMEPPPSSVRGYMDGKLSRPWSPTGRPIVNTTLSNHPSLPTPSDLSPHPSSVPTSSHSSSWSHNASVTTSQAAPHYMIPPSAIPGDVPEQSTNMQSFSNNDWNNLLSAPLTPTVFAALAANGFMAPISSSSGTPSSLPASSFHTHYHPPSARPQVTTANVMPQSGPTGSWPQSPATYSPTSPYSPKPHLPRLNSSTSNIHHGKGKAASNMSHFTPIQPRPVDTALAPGRSVDDGQLGGRLQGLNTLQNAGPIHRVDMGAGAGGFDPSIDLLSHTPLDYTPGYPYQGERSNTGLPPSLWMSSAAPSTPAVYEMLNQLPSSAVPEVSPSNRSPYTQSPTSPMSPTTDSKSGIFTDIFSDELFGPQAAPLSDQSTSPFTSPRLSGSPDLQSLIGTDANPELLAKDDPLATQIWKMYARTKATLPHAQRMENLTWRMMALELKKRKEDEAKLVEAEAKLAEAMREKNNPGEQPNVTTDIRHSYSGLEEGTDPGASNERGRRIGKGKGKVRVVGFDGTNQDGFEEEE